MATLLWIIKICAIISILLPAQCQKIAGPFFCINEGFFPRTVDNEIISYVTDIKPNKNNKDNYEDKRMYGTFNLKKTVKKLRAVSTVYKESGNSWLRRGMPMTYENMCNIKYDMDNFKKCFSGMWKGDPCTLEAGQYILKNWTFEDDLKKTLDNKMFYGHYKFELNVQGVVEDSKGREKEFELPLELRLWVKDEAEKLRVPAGNAKGGHKHKG